MKYWRSLHAPKREIGERVQSDRVRHLVLSFFVVLGFVF